MRRRLVEAATFVMVAAGGFLVALWAYNNLRG